MSPRTADHRDSLTFRKVDGEDSSSPWHWTAELVHGRVHVHLWRGHRDRYPLNIRMSLDEASAMHADLGDLIGNERARQAHAQRQGA